MTFEVKLSDTFNCSLERAFKAPILGDATRFLNGYFFQPPVVAFEEDSTWGQEQGIRYPVTCGNLLVPRGRIFTDKILSRVENRSWEWIIYDFNLGVMFFAENAVGRWKVWQVDDLPMVQVEYSYTFRSKHLLFHPFAIIFARLQWRGMMKKALLEIRRVAESDESFIYE